MICCGRLQLSETVGRALLPGAADASVNATLQMIVADAAGGGAGGSQGPVTSALPRVAEGPAVLCRQEARGPGAHVQGISRPARALAAGGQLYIDALRWAPGTVAPSGGAAAGPGAAAEGGGGGRPVLQLRVLRLADAGTAGGRPDAARGNIAEGAEECPGGRRPERWQPGEPRQQVRGAPRQRRPEAPQPRGQTEEQRGSGDGWHELVSGPLLGGRGARRWCCVVAGSTLRRLRTSTA